MKSLILFNIRTVSFLIMLLFMYILGVLITVSDVIFYLFLYAVAMIILDIIWPTKIKFDKPE